MRPILDQDPYESIWAKGLYCPPREGHDGINYCDEGESSVKAFGVWHVGEMGLSK